MPGVAHAAKFFFLNFCYRPSRDDGDAVITFLPVYREMLITVLSNVGERKLAVSAFRFLKAKNVGSMVSQKIEDERKAKADGVDVPSCDL